MTKRPWTQDVKMAKCRCGHHACDQYTLSNQGTMGFSEADARLFAASPAMRDALEAALTMLTKFHNYPLDNPGIMQITAALAKANQNVQASEPEGENK